MLKAIPAALSALTAFSRKVEATADNVANVETNGFKANRIQPAAGPAGGVTTHLSKDPAPGPLVPEETTSGPRLVEGSNVDLTREIPNLLLARRSYQANLKTIQTEDQMLGDLLDTVG